MSSLFLIEQEIGRRVGPYFQDEAASGTTASVTIPALQSSLDLGDNWTGTAFLLRRGLIRNQAPVIGGFDVTDRVRRVASYTPSSGVLTPDRSWSRAPIANETMELHYLDPIQELRVVALAGLERCFFVDRALVTLTQIGPEQDITSAVPWITNRDQIFEVSWMWPASIYPPRPILNWDTFEQDGHVWLRFGWAPYLQHILVTARRAVGTALNTAVDLRAPVALVTDATNASPIVLTVPAHGFSSGQYVGIVGVTGNTAANGTWPISVIDANTFALLGSVGNGTYGSGGQATLNDYEPDAVADTDEVPADPDYAAAWGHMAAWQYFPDRLIPAAQIGLKATQAMVAAEASRQAAKNYTPLERCIQVGRSFANVRGGR